MNRFWTGTLLSAALLIPITLTPASLLADDHKDSRNYHDKEHNDDHQWNAHEDRAYRLYVKQNHRKYKEFSKLGDSDQQAYWGWRHEHSDALLKIVIR